MSSNMWQYLTANVFNVGAKSARTDPILRGAEGSLTGRGHYFHLIMGHTRSCSLTLTWTLTQTLKLADANIISGWTGRLRRAGMEGAMQAWALYFAAFH